MAPMNNRLLRPRASGVSHPEAADWAARVTANGGTVSSITLKAVSDFCRSIDTAGIRDRFYRLNLFCGNSDGSLNAVRTPLYRGPSLAGTQHGNATDTAANFVAGDYAEAGVNGGLTGSSTATAKYLDTGFVLSDAAVTSTGHIAAYRGLGSLATSRVVMGCLNTAFTQIYQIARVSSGAFYDVYYGAVAPLSSPTPSFPGDENALLLATRVASNSALFYYKTANTGAVATNVSPATSERSLFVFARNQGTPASHAAITIRSYSVGASMTQSQVSDYNTALQGFFAAIGRDYL